jgi:hypothetical protein
MFPNLVARTITPPTTGPAPMPDPNSDPDILAGRQTQQTYLTAVQKIRGNFQTSDLAKAEALNTAYTEYVNALQASRDHLNARRRARLDFLEQQLPVGPGIPDDATPADRAVLMAAFRTAYDRAMATDRVGRARMLGDAEKFDDDAARRGTLTAVMEASDVNTLRDWARQHITTAGWLDEVQLLRALLANQSNDPQARFAQQAFQAVRQPFEATRLPRLQQAAARAAALAQANGPKAAGFYNPR